jgi:predicted transcriptional regulator
MSNKQILNVGISSPGESLAHFAKVWSAAAGGKKVKPYNGIGFESIAQFAAALTPQRWLLINVLKSIGPSSIYALAKKLERHYKNVHSDVAALVQLGIIEKDAENKVFVPWDEIDVNMPLARAA